MNQEVRNLEPQVLWNFFADLNSVPRASKKEEKIIAFIQHFGQKLNLETITDDAGNVLIKKPASPGMEKRLPIVLQAHLDMVHQKNDNTLFDFNTQGIEMFVNFEWVKAKETTLGADNGIGVATIMALLASTDVAHPPIEALFTIDEETGMTGAKGLQPNWLQGKLMLNLDTEEDDEIDIGCAGGIDITVNTTYTPEKTADNYISYIVTVTGLNGGHSGLEIHKGLGNANKIMNRILYHTQSLGLRICSVDGGSLRNAIPRESKAVIGIPDNSCHAFENSINRISEIIKTELAHTDAGLTITAVKTKPANNWMPLQLQLSFIKSIYAVQNGVYAMSHVVPNLVETSNNLACVAVGDGKIKILCLARSASETAKTDLAQSIQSAFELMPAEVTLSGSYPGWLPDANSKLLKLVCTIYSQLNKQQPKIVACHAGLECGIIKSKYPIMDMISIGPIIKGAHSPNERVHIKSVQKFWIFLNEILKSIPEA